MKRLLYFAFFFPPLGGAGVQRTLKFVRYLPEFGWQATVVTAEASYWMEDPSLLAEIDPDTAIRRVAFPGAGLLAVKGSGTARSHGRIRFLRGAARFFALPDAYRPWARAAERAGGELLRPGSFQAILTTSSPDSTHLIGRSLRRRFRLPWIADFRDPWTRRLSYAPPTRWHDAWHRRQERACLREADRIVVTSEETREDFLRHSPQVSAEKIVVIPNGYDEEDFRDAAAGGGHGDSDWIPPDGFDLLHAGQLNPERPIEPFLRGLRRYFDRHPQDEGRRRVWFVGGHYDRDRDATRRCRVEDSVVFLASRPHRESIRALLAARALLLLEQDSDRGRLVLPGKFWEYARARRPILALVPESGAADRSVRRFQAGIWADPADPEAIADGLERIWGGPAMEVPEVDLNPFERRALTRCLADTLDAVAPEATAR